MMSHILNILDQPVFDGSIIKRDHITINPKNPNALSNNDIIEFSHEQADTLILPSESFFIVSLKLKKGSEQPATTSLSKGGVLHIFNRATLKINSKTVEDVFQPALVGLSRIYTTYDQGRAQQLDSMGLDSDTNIKTGAKITAEIPCDVLFGMCEDFDKVLVNTTLDIALTRSRSDIDALFATVEETDVTLTVTKIQLKLVKIEVDDATRLKLLKLIEKDTPLKIFFRSWDLYQNTALPSSKSISWTIRSTSQHEIPRFVLIACQTARTGVVTKSSSEFDHCKVENIKVFLNNEPYPNENQDQNIPDKNYIIFYRDYKTFAKTFNGLIPNFRAIWNYEKYINSGPIYVINCMFHKESVKYGAVTVRVDIQSSEAFPASTNMYAIFGRDTVYTYKPLSNSIEKYEG